MKITEYPVVSGYADPPKTSEAVFPLLDEASQKLVVALRVVCGGSAVTTRSLFAQADGEFPFAPGPAAMLNRFDSADNDRPTILHIDSIDILRSVYGALALPHVVADRSLQVAIRRLVYAGVRATDTDRLVDLMTAAEALFIKRANLIGATKGDKIATGAEAMLARDPQFDSGGPLLHAFMTMAYRARNAEIHGDGKPYKSLHMLSGQPTTSLADVVGDAESIMRRAIMTVLTC